MGHKCQSHNNGTMHRLAVPLYFGLCLLLAVSLASVLYPSAIKPAFDCFLFSNALSGHNVAGHHMQLFQSDLEG